MGSCGLYFHYFSSCYMWKKFFLCRAVGSMGGGCFFCARAARNPRVNPLPLLVLWYKKVGAGIFRKIFYKEGGVQCI